MSEQEIARGIREVNPQQLRPSPGALRSPGMAEHDAYPFWIAMGAACVGTLLGGAAVWIGVHDRLDHADARTARIAPPAEPREVADTIAADPEAVLRDGEGDTAIPDPGESPLVRAVADTRDSVVSLDIGGRVRGSGVVYDAGGLVLTNYHVIEPMLQAQGFGGVTRVTSATARFADGRGRPAKVVAADPDEDIAILRLAPDHRGGVAERFAAAPVGESALLRLGEQVFAIGSPVGFEATVATGIVSALDRTEILAKRQLPLIQLDAAINFGNSGGPLFNLRGELVGITTARSSRGEGIGFAIPIDRIRLFLQALEDGTGGRSGMIGVELDPRADISVVEAHGYRSGIRIGRVDPDRPAAASGLRDDDILVSIRGRRHDELDSSIAGRFEFGQLFGETIRAALPGETIDVEVVRPRGLGAEGSQGPKTDLLALQLEVEAASAEEQGRIDAEELLGLYLDPDADVPTVAGIVPGSPVSRIRGVSILERATIVDIVHEPIADVEQLGDRLMQLRGVVGGGRRTIALTFETTDGQRIEASAYPLARAR